ncbi:MAG: exopolysaccharide Pel transporter PelG [Burkholderiales bacterium]
MAGIGFVLQRFLQTDRLTTNLQGLAHAGVVSSGPWLFSCLALACIQLLGRPFADAGALQQFTILTVYNFSFSLVIAGPIVLVVTRCVADAIYAKQMHEVSDLLLGALCLLFSVTALFGVPFYGFFLDLAPLDRLVAFAGLMLTGGIWLAAAFMSALKSYSSISTAFGAGMLGAVLLAAWLAPRMGGSGLLVSFTFGLAVIFFTLVARVFAEFPGRGARLFGFLRAFPRYWELAWVGLFYNAAIWVDKWIMWFVPGPVAPAGPMLANPAYEGAMFLAYLSTVPAMALFLIDVETRFYRIYVRFYRQISEHATLAEIRSNHADLTEVLGQSLRRIALLQGTVCVVGILLASAVIQAVGGGLEMVPIFRFGLLGALFHVLLTLTLAVLAYFDLRRLLLGVSLTYLLLNAGFTLLSVWLGEQFHGWGYFIATAVTFAIAFFLAASRLGHLPYLTFVSNNATVRSPPSKAE